MRLKNEFISSYLDLVENTETPRIFHTWSAISGIAACLGRRVWLPFGFKEIYANQYVLLVGPPAVKKSTALGIVQDMLKKATNVKFAPDDTGGQRQGLLSAMQTAEETDDEKQLREALEELESGHQTIGSLSQTDFNLADMQIDLRDPHTMFACQSELQALLGQNNQEILTFLIKLWDGEDYQYQLKSTNLSIENAVINLLSGTTPSSLAQILPPQAIGHGFTSRVIFVYANQKYKQVPRPSAFDPELHGLLCKVFSEIFYNFDGAMQETKHAAALYDHLYMTDHNIQDPRFVHYSERRAIHLLKVSMSLAACNLRMTIEEEDVRLADELLTATEENMPEAMGEFGLNRLSAAKQKFWEYLQGSSEPIPTAALQSFMAKDMSRLDFQTTVNEFINAGKASVVDIKGLGQCIMATALEKKRKSDTLFEMMKKDRQENV